ncbi:MAG TPA: PP2C family protein-serine/threonine phosphatase [Planctomycetota bacterium]
MAESKKRNRGQTRISQIRVPEPPPPLHGIAENLYSLQQDLEVARKIQTRLLPPPPDLPRWDFDVHYQPAGEVGGDFYDFLEMGEGRLGILAADASGKGLAGALLMVEARAMIRAMASIASSPREILTAVNKVLLRDLQKGTFVTIFFALLDTVKRTLTMANAGHTPMLIWQEELKQVVRHQPRGFVLGAATEARFGTSLDEGTVQLKPGDRFLLFTDGVSELMNPVSDEFGMERLEAWMAKNSSLSSSAFIRDLNIELEGHQAGQQQSDDITIVTGRLLRE